MDKDEDKHKEERARINESHQPAHFLKAGAIFRKRLRSVYAVRIVGVGAVTCILYLSGHDQMRHPHLTLAGMTLALGGMAIGALWLMPPTLCVWCGEVLDWTKPLDSGPFMRPAEWNWECVKCKHARRAKCAYCGNALPVHFRVSYRESLTTRALRCDRCGGTDA